MKHSYLRHESKRRAVLRRRYNKLRETFLEENPWCIVAGCDATEVHHKAGRVGDLFLDTSKWAPVCAEHHRYITEHPREAVARGWSLPRVALVPVDGVERAG